MILLDPVHPNVGIELAYRRQLEYLITQMSNSVLYWVSAAYKQNPPRLAQDESSAATMKRTIRELSRRWQRRFNEVSLLLARQFSKSVKRQTDVSLAASLLRNASMTINFTMTPEMRDVLLAGTYENVNLIKSIPQHYFTQVEGEIMRSVMTGRDLATLTEQLGPKVDLSRIRRGLRPLENEESYFMRTYRRAGLIAQDQNNKMTTYMHRARELELGIEKAAWLHSGAGKEPRPEHVAWGRERKVFDIEQGMWSEKEGRFIQPGELINCRCHRRPIILQ